MIIMPEKFKIISINQPLKRLVCTSFKERLMLLLLNGQKPLLENRYFMIQGNKAFFFIIPKI